MYTTTADIYFLGRGSVGKSLLFESVVLATGHQIISSTSNNSGDAGVGRFQTSSKNTASINILTLHIK
jgi:GTP-binding protein EngB required for normal cell division